VRPTEENLRKTRQALADMAGTVRFSRNNNLASTWGVTRQTQPTEPWFAGGRVITVALNPRFLRATKEVQRRNDAIIATRLWFFLAETITHELAHAVGRVVKMKGVDESIAPDVKRIQNLPFEPFTEQNEPSNELGEPGRTSCSGAYLTP